MQTTSRNVGVVANPHTTPAAGTIFAASIVASARTTSGRIFRSKEPNNFAGIDWRPAELDCAVASVHDGDHFVVFGAVEFLSEAPTITPRPLLFYCGDCTGIEPDKTTPACH